MNAGHLLSAYGYWAVLAGVSLESVGIPLPGETILVAAGVYAGHTHRLSVWAIFAVASVAAIVGDNVGFWIGSKGGCRLLQRHGHYLFIDAAKLKVGRYIFDRHGAKVVFFGRFVSILRTYAAMLAGLNRMRWRRFLTYNAAGGLVWSAAFSFGAYGTGDALRRASATINLSLAGAVAVAMTAALVGLRRRAGRLTLSAEAAYPGALTCD